MANVLLVNKTKRPARMLVLNLTAQIAPVRVENRTMEETRQGDRKLRISTKTVPDSIRIPARGQVEVDESYLRAPDVVAAVAAGHVVILEAPAQSEARESATVTDSEPEPELKFTDSEPEPKLRRKK